MTFIQKAEAVKTVRKTAAQTCLLSFQKVYSDYKKTSELRFTNTWTKLMEKSNKIHGFWYQPPPTGIAALFFDNMYTDRANYSSLRERNFWPKSNNFLNNSGGGYLFASPFYMINDIPLIGDFGFSFYTGNDPEIKEHYHQCSIILNSLLKKIEPGMKFSRLYTEAVSLMKKKGYGNYIKSSTDKLGTNIGHTIPFLENDPTISDLGVINTGSEEKINNLISIGRIFINENSNFVISNNCGFTFEPRFISLKNQKLPMFSLHQIILFIDGRKEILSDFDGIFNFLKLNY
ncbi:hypothetical protein A2W14_06825 [Candidatus Gottesmanbacteria bacterium RBG_16_37_8]|uniref:Peptidase M24 domain-containing protein n=1 Tax=Candidatus Gottesmanbacteria bacterium RBG_16_37_8 TaxID=1798371 RepID=A0A1F5YWC6_9BACT|nr:MAG: hypothetical protein A2W14_06825 [Candidatus Gottesmanbacteria bacterium RBG_16_37_8]